MRHRGFTLLEVMVALAIALPALLLLYRQGALALEITGSSMATQNALSRAQSHLAALAATDAAAGDREGDDGGGYRWHTRIVPLNTADPARGVSARSPYAAGATLYAASVRIAWNGPRGERSVTLETRLLGPSLQPEAASAPP